MFHRVYSTFNIEIGQMFYAQFLLLENNGTMRPFDNTEVHLYSFAYLKKLMEEPEHLILNKRSRRRRFPHYATKVLKEKKLLTQSYLIGLTEKPKKGVPYRVQQKPYK